MTSPGPHGPGQGPGPRGAGGHAAGLGYTPSVLKIRGLAVDPPLLLAPMAGVTDSAFRRVVRSAGGCGLVTVDFVSSEAVVRAVERELARLRFAAEERPLAVQIYGARPEVMAAAAELVEAAGADACDVNLGCPARPVVRTGAGVALMGEPDLARRILAEVRRRLSIPLTAKIRSGLAHDRLNDLELGRICQGEGVDAITLHPRTARQQYTGSADWSRIGRLKRELTIPVVGNGDVSSAEDARRMLEETGCDGVMIGRAAVANPWLFRQASQLLAGATPFEPSLDERVALVRRHLAIVLAELEGFALLHRLRLLARWASRGLPGGRRLRQQLAALDSAESLRSAIDAFLDRCTSGEVVPDPPENPEQGLR